jgi:hypothetical protein
MIFCFVIVSHLCFSALDEIKVHNSDGAGMRLDPEFPLKVRTPQEVEFKLGNLKGTLDLGGWDSYTALYPEVERTRAKQVCEKDVCVWYRRTCRKEDIFTASEVMACRLEFQFESMPHSYVLHLRYPTAADVAYEFHNIFLIAGGSDSDRISLETLRSAP